MTRRLLAAWLGLCLLVPVAAKAGDRHAFLVAVTKYDEAELNSLRFTENDANDLAAALRKGGYSDENIVLMTQSVGSEKARFLPTASHIHKELALLLDELEAEDTLIVAFSGHGVQFKGDKLACFCPADASLSDRETLVPLADVYAALEKCPATRKVLLVDACRNEPVSEVGRAQEIKLDPVGIQPPEPAAGIAALFSCSASQKSFEHPDLKHGVFFHFVIEGLGGAADVDNNGDVTLAELEAYYPKKVKTFVRTRLGRAQTPALKGDVEGDFALASFSATSTPPIPKPARTISATPSPKPTPTPTGDLKPLDVIENSIGMKLVLIPAGEFDMGSPTTEMGRNADETQHHVRLTHDFFLGQTEVTQGQYAQVVGENPSYFSRTGGGEATVAGLDTSAFPVEQVSWLDAQEFCGKLSALASEKGAGREYRLPTEAEWEYACRGGKRTAFAYGDSLSSTQANFDGSYPYGGAAKGNCLQRPATVGSYKSNTFGLFDMHGNVWEWCADYYGDYPAGARVDPNGPDSGSGRVRRGGQLNCYASACRSARRVSYSADSGGPESGFRVAVSSP